MRTPHILSRKHLAVNLLFVILSYSYTLLQLLRVTGISNIPVWYEAGAVKFKFANTETLFIVQLILMG